jgi:hypothetical protein
LGKTGSDWSDPNLRRLFAEALANLLQVLPKMVHALILEKNGTNLLPLRGQIDLIEEWQ